MSNKGEAITVIAVIVAVILFFSSSKSAEVQYDRGYAAGMRKGYEDARDYVEDAIYYGIKEDENSVFYRSNGAYADFIQYIFEEYCYYEDYYEDKAAEYEPEYEPPDDPDYY